MCEGNLLNLVVILLIIFVLTDISNSKHLRSVVQVIAANYTPCELPVSIRIADEFADVQLRPIQFTGEKSALFNQ